MATSSFSYERSNDLDQARDSVAGTSGVFTKLCNGSTLSRRFKGLIEATAQIVWTADPDGFVVEDSPSWRKFTGQSLCAFLGSGWTNAIHPDDRAQTFLAWMRARRTRNPYEVSYRLSNTQGEWRWTQSRGIPLFDDEGNAEGWIGLTNDIHDRKLAEQALMESELHFRALAESSPGFFWIATPDAQVYYWNPAWYEYTGLSPEQSFGVNAAAAIPEEVRSEILEKWKTSVSTNSVFNAEIPLRRHDGVVRWFLARANPVCDDNGAVKKWAGSMLDISHQKRASTKLVEERCAREKFVATLAHDLKNALASGKASLQILKRYPERQDLAEKHLAIIAKSILRVEGMVVDLLDANRLRAGDEFLLKGLSRFDMCHFLKQSVESLNHVHPGRFVFEGEGEVWGEWSDCDLLRVLENLASNAVKYGDPKKPITIRLQEASGEVGFSVHNFGAAISSQRKSQIFDFMSRAGREKDSVHEGWGIGLSLVMGIARAHGGRVTVRSEEGEGTTFTVSLPRNSLAEAIA